MLRPRQTENKRPVDPLCRCLAPRDDRLKMLGDAAVARQQLDSRWTGAQPERPSRRRGAKPSHHHPPPASGKPARVLIPAQRPRAKGRSSRGRPGWVPPAGGLLPSQSPPYKRDPSVPPCSHGVSPGDLKEILFSLAGQQLTTTLISVAFCGLRLPFLAPWASELTFDPC